MMHTASPAARTQETTRSTPPSGLALRTMLQRRCACGASAEGECESCGNARKEKLRRSPERSDSVEEAPESVHRVLRSSGHPLDPDTRQFFEARFGRDLGGVRVHSDEPAAESARSVNALAYTVGSDIVFGSGHYRPHSAAGRKLMAHEMTHVVQQNPFLARKEPAAGAQPAASKGATAGTAARVGRLASLLEGYATKADAKLGSSGAGADKLALVRSDLADLKDGIQQLRQVAAGGDSALSAAVLSGFTPARLKAAGQLLIPATPQAAKQDAVAVAEQTEPSIATKSLEVAKPYTAAEAEADRVAEAVMSDCPAELSSGSEAPMIQRFLDSAAAAALEAELPVVAAESTVVAETAVVTGTAAAGSEAALGVAAGVAAAGGPPGWVIGLAIVAVVVIVAVGGYLYYRSRTPETLVQPKPQPQPQPQPRPLPVPDPRPPVPDECVEKARQLSTPDCNFTAHAGQSGGDPLADLFCENATGTDCEYWVSSVAGQARFDAIKGHDVYECKCGYESLVRAVKRGDRIAQLRLNDLLEQLLRHLRITRHCGLQYRIIVSNSDFADFLRGELGANVDVVVQPFEPCD